MSADEFEIIRTLFAPLATGAGARGLVDDAAVIGATGDLVVTTDAIVEGVHFLPEDPIGDVAKKALRVNLSDLAGKGAKPLSALLTLVWPDARPSDQIAAFAKGLGEDLRAYDIALIGGDTASTPGPLTISIAAFGAPIGSRTPSRADARVGDDIWVTGTLGDAWLGYLALNGELKNLAETERAAVVSRYRLPQPRVDLAPLVARFANAAMDISDGLAGDAAKLASASGVALRIDADRVPLSAAGRAWKGSAGDFGRLLDWGDDYELLFTADPAARAAIATAAPGQATRIGQVEAGLGVRFVRDNGADAGIAARGHSHRLGR